MSSSYSPVWFIEKGVWRKEMNLTGDECFKEEFADTETFELSLKGRSGLLGQGRQEDDSKYKGRPH